MRNPLFACSSIPTAVVALVLSSTAHAATLMVGPNQMYAKPCQAIAAAKAGDVIEVDAAGNYNGDTCAWSTNALTVRGVNGRAKIDLKGVTPAQQKGIFTISAESATVENFEFSGAAISQNAGNNGAGIRHQGLNLTVRNCFFHDNQDGILGSPSTAGQGEVLIENSEFAHNGAGDGFSHNMYLGNYARFTLQYSYSHTGNVGHLVKSRAHQSNLLYNRLTDENGTASYEIDLPNGGTAIVIGNIVEQGANTMNSTIVAFAEEGVPMGYDDSLFLVNNTIINDRKSGTFVVDKGATPAVLTNNIFYNGGTITSQNNAAQTANFDSGMGNPMFVNVAQFDVHLAGGSPCIDKGKAPGMGGGQSLDPNLDYVHPLSVETRAVVGMAIDIGAYEFGNMGMMPPDGGGPLADMSSAGTADMISTGGADMSGSGSDASTGGSADLEATNNGDLAMTAACQDGCAFIGEAKVAGCDCETGAARSPGGSPSLILLFALCAALAYAARRGTLKKQ